MVAGSCYARSIAASQPRVHHLTRNNNASVQLCARQVRVHMRASILPRLQAYACSHVHTLELRGVDVHDADGLHVLSSLPQLSSLILSIWLGLPKDSLAHDGIGNAIQAFHHAMLRMMTDMHTRHRPLLQLTYSVCIAFHASQDMVRSIDRQMEEFAVSLSQHPLAPHLLYVDIRDNASPMPLSILPRFTNITKLPQHTYVQSTQDLQTIMPLTQLQQLSLTVWLTPYDVSLLCTLRHVTQLKYSWPRSSPHAPPIQGAGNANAASQAAAEQAKVVETLQCMYELLNAMATQLTELTLHGQFYPGYRMPLHLTMDRLALLTFTQLHTLTLYKCRLYILSRLAFHSATKQLWQAMRRLTLEYCQVVCADEGEQPLSWEAMEDMFSRYNVPSPHLPQLMSFILSQQCM